MSKKLWRTTYYEERILYIMVDMRYVLSRLRYAVWLGFFQRFLLYMVYQRLLLDQ